LRSSFGFRKGSCEAFGGIFRRAKTARAGEGVPFDTSERVQEVVMQDSQAGPRRILVVANETVAGELLVDEIARRASEGRHEVLVIAPALTRRLRFLVSDIDGGLAQAQERVDESLDALRARGVQARGEVADSDPLLAIEDAIATFSPHEIVISTHPPGRSNWLEKKVVPRARERFEVPIDHIVVDLEKERSEAAAGSRSASV
jgi:hypothetical protein